MGGGTGFRGGPLHGPPQIFPAAMGAFGGKRGAGKTKIPPGKFPWDCRGGNGHGLGIWEGQQGRRSKFLVFFRGFSRLCGARRKSKGKKGQPPGAKKRHRADEHQIKYRLSHGGAGKGPLRGDGPSVGGKFGEGRTQGGQLRLRGRNPGKRRRFPPPRLFCWRASGPRRGLGDVCPPDDGADFFIKNPGDWVFEKKSCRCLENRFYENFMGPDWAISWEAGAPRAGGFPFPKAGATPDWYFRTDKKGKLGGRPAFLGPATQPKGRSNSWNPTGRKNNPTGQKVFTRRRNFEFIRRDLLQCVWGNKRLPGITRTGNC